MNQERLQQLRAAASLQNYKEACASQWDENEEAEDDEIQVEDVIMRAPIQKSDF